MSGKQSKKERAEDERFMVDIRKLTLGMDTTTGRIIIGTPEDSGDIDMNSAFNDITDDFYLMVQGIVKLRAAAMEKQLGETQQGPKIIQPTAKEINELAGR